MSSPNGDEILDETLIVMGLMLLGELITKSGYPTEVQLEIKTAAGRLVEHIQAERRRANDTKYDAYGNPY